MNEHRYKHQWNKQNGKWRNAQHRNPFSSILPAHGPFQPFCNKVHTWHHDQRHKESEGQTKDDGPGKWLPENSAIASKENMWIQFGEHGNEINIEANRQRNQGKNGGKRGKQYRDDPDFSCLYHRFSCFHSTRP